MCVLITSTTSTHVWDIFILRRIERDMMKKRTGLRVKHSLFLSDFKDTLIFSTDFSKNTRIWNLMKIRPVEADLFHADGRTDGQTGMTKLTVAFHDFATAPKNWETKQRLTCHYDLFRQIIHLKKAMSKRNLFCFNAAFIGNMWKGCRIGWI